MPGNFPEVYLNRVRTTLDNDGATLAPWLDGISELDTPVLETGTGTETENNTIHVPTSMFEPNVLVDNTTYPLNVTQYADGTSDLKLHKFDTEGTSISDDQADGASYSLIDTATGSHTRAITKKKYARAIHALAPNANTGVTPVLLTTGPLVGGRRQMIYEDLVALAAACDDAGIPTEGRRLVLCNDHKNDLLLDRKNFGDQLVNYRTGQPAPVIAGFQIFSYINNPHYNPTTKVKLPWPAVPGAGDKRASVVFYETNVMKKTGATKQYFSKSSGAPLTKLNILNYRHYFMALPLFNNSGAIVSATS